MVVDTATPQTASLKNQKNPAAAKKRLKNKRQKIRKRLKSLEEDAEFTKLKALEHPTPEESEKLKLKQQRVDKAKNDLDSLETEYQSFIKVEKVKKENERAKGKSPVKQKSPKKSPRKKAAPATTPGAAAAAAQVASPQPKGKGSPKRKPEKGPPGALRAVPKNVNGGKVDDQLAKSEARVAELERGKKGDAKKIKDLQAQINNLKQHKLMAKSKDAKVVTLREKVTHMEQRQESQKALLGEKVKDVVEELDIAQAEIQRLNAQIEKRSATSEHRTAQIQKMLNEKSNELEATQKDYQRIKKDLAKSQMMEKQFASIIAQKSKDNSNKKEMEKANSMLSQAIKQSNKDKTQIQDLKNQIEKLKAQAQKAPVPPPAGDSAKVEELTASLKRANVACVTFQNQLKGASDKLASTEKDLATARTNLESAKKKTPQMPMIPTLKATVPAVDSQAKAKVEELKAKLARANVAQASLEAKLKKAQSQGSDFKSQAHDDLKAKLTKAEQQLAAEAKQTTKLKADLSKAQKTMKELPVLEKKLASAQTEAKQIPDLKAQLTAAQTKAKQVGDLTAQLTAAQTKAKQVESLTKQLAEAKDKHAHLQKEGEKSQAQIKELTQLSENEAAAQKKKYGQLEKELAAQKKELASSQKSLKSMNAAASASNELSTRLATLEQEKKDLQKKCDEQEQLAEKHKNMYEDSKKSLEKKDKLISTHKTTLNKEQNKTSDALAEKVAAVNVKRDLEAQISRLKDLKASADKELQTSRETMREQDKVISKKVEEALAKHKRQLSQQKKKTAPAPTSSLPVSPPCEKFLLWTKMPLEAVFALLAFTVAFFFKIIL